MFKFKIKQTGSQIWENGRLSTLEFYWYNQLTILPDNFGNLSSLKTLWLFFNQLTSLPESIGNLSSLENFELSWSQITDIPESITDRGYEKPKQMLSRQKIYIPIITFNADSSEMGGYAFKIK